MRIAFLVHAIGPRYIDYAKGLIESARTHVKREHIWHVFTDDRRAGWPDDVVIHKVPTVGWPDASLYRYERSLCAERVIDADICVQIDADMRFVAPIVDEFLVESFGVFHPSGRVNYFAGALFGGYRAEFFDRLWELARDAAAARRYNRPLEWHDETVLNAHFVNRPPQTKLGVEYCWPDSPGKYYRGLNPNAGEPRILALTKPMDAHAT